MKSDHEAVPEHLTSVEAEALRVHGLLTSEIVRSGLDWARRNDPHTFKLAQNMAAQGGCSLQVRIELPIGGLGLPRTEGVLLDQSGEAVASLFSIAPAATERAH